MVKSTGTPERLGSFRSLNIPHAINVKVNKNGAPIAVWLWQRWIQIDSVDDQWHLEDEWWRKRPINRTYFSFLLENETRVTVYHDHINGQWYRQNA